MVNQYKPKKLIVEGDEDKRVIPELIEQNGIKWKNPKHQPIVDIQSYGGYENINADVISTELKISGRTHLGLIVDADEDFNARWESVRNACLKSIPDIPKELPESGLVLTTLGGIKFGVWIMPDNKARGMLETFLAYMIPDERELLWTYAQEVVQEAKTKGATFIDAHLDKANIYTWLAWQKPPGRQLHQAVTQKIIEPNHPKAQTFITWFRNLYDL